MWLLIKLARTPIPLKLSCIIWPGQLFLIAENNKHLYLYDLEIIFPLNCTCLFDSSNAVQGKTFTPHPLHQKSIKNSNNSHFRQTFLAFATLFTLSQLLPHSLNFATLFHTFSTLNTFSHTFSILSQSRAQSFNIEHNQSKFTKLSQSLTHSLST